MTKKLSTAMAAAGLLIAVAAGPAFAEDYVILESNAAGIDPGLVIDSAAMIELPEGAAVVLISPGGKTFALAGPYSGKVAAASAGGGASQSTIERLLQTREQDTKVLGAVRSPKIGGGSVSE